MYLVKYATALAIAATEVVAALPATLVYQFPSKPYYDIENIAVRPSGDLIFTSINNAQVQTINPCACNAPNPQVLYKFPAGNATVGIAQYAPDQYAVVVGEYNFQTFGGVPGSFQIWTLVFKGTYAPVVKNVANITAAHALNGMTAVPSTPGIVLVADSVLGVVYSVNLTSGAYKVAIQDDHFSPTSKFPLGINGIHLVGGKLYFTNSAKGLYGSVPIANNGSATGNVSIIARAPAGHNYDDFAIDSKGNAWITTHPNEILQVTAAGVQTIQAGGGNSTTIDQPTSAIFGYGKQNGTLYVVTAGDVGQGATSGQIYSLQI